MKTYNILTIGDLHGKDVWKQIINKYNQEDDLHKIVFLGDYLDSFDVSKVGQLENLRELIEFKERFPYIVELLIGNHDIQYYLPMSFIDKNRCSGFQSESHFDYHIIFKQYKNLFK